jgi:hypothetical protein
MASGEAKVGERLGAVGRRPETAARIADLADQWLRSGQIPTADEWATLTRRVHGISAIIDLWDEQATPYGLEI